MTIYLTLKNGSYDFLKEVYKVKQDEKKFEVFSELGHYIFKMDEINEVVIDFQ